ncbi:MAG: hypothetical protein J6C05_02080 [Prevotella sp.]|nr:hypothetical protein [Prevotella sp.]
MRRYRILSLVTAFLCSTGMPAQDSDYKDGAFLWSIGAGYEWMSDAYSSRGFAMDVHARFYTSGRMFWELTGHWGTHDGDKEVLQKGDPFRIDDHRNILMGAVGPGYDLWQNSDCSMNVYVKGLVGYGSRKMEYDSFEPIGDADGIITLGKERTKSGLAFVVGAGFDTRYKRYTLTPSVDVYLLCGEWHVVPMLSVGFYY